MINDDTIVNYLKNAYGEHGNFSKRMSFIFETLKVDKVLAIDAFYEIYSQEDYFDKPLEYRYIYMPSYAKLRNLTMNISDYVFDRLAFSYVIHDITKEKIFYKNKLDTEDINLALENLEVGNFHLGAFIQCIIKENYSLQNEDLNKSIQALGGLTRARKYQAIKKQIFNDWKSGAFHSYAECARRYSERHKLSTKTIENWLSKEFSTTKENV